MDLRSYQIDAIKAIKSTFKKNDRQYVEMPTGSGKTITFLSYASKNHERILIVVPSKQLLRQVFETALLFYHKSELSRKGDGHNEIPQKVHICIINSIRGDYLEFITGQYFDLIIIDEAHHAQSDSYKRLINNQTFAPKILGVTATPDRADGLMLNEILHMCSFKLSIEELIEAKHLSDIEGYSVKTKIDISDIDSHNGDFSLKELYNRLCTNSRNQMIVDICKKEMKDRKTLIFCINIAHSLQIKKLLNENHVTASHIDGKTPDNEKHAILKAFRDGEIPVLCNCQLLTEGFDEPSIDGIILARPTKSRALFTQMIGRGLRKAPGKRNCKIIDIVDNHRTLAGFNCLLEDCQYPEINSFKSLRDIRKHLGEEMLKVTEFRIEKVNFFNNTRIDDMEALPCMFEYLQDQKIQYFEPLSFDEASFLIWHNELKKEYVNGTH